MNSMQLERMYRKLRRFTALLEQRLFLRLTAISRVDVYETEEKLHEIPSADLYHPVESGEIWGGEGKTAWFHTTLTVSEEMAGKALFLWPRLGSYETMLWVNGEPFGAYASKIAVTRHGNHYCCRFREKAEAGERITLDLEAYAGHYVIGWTPLEERERLDFRFPFEGLDICVKDEAVADFYFDLRTVTELYESLPDTSSRKGELLDVLLELHQTLLYSPDDASPEEFYGALSEGSHLLKETLSHGNGASAPVAGLVGHSHMDTAWLWDVDETVRKCARTFANQLNLMEQYPEHHFLQTSACHTEMIRKNYPSLFARIQERVREGRYEPNGAVFVECDCNIVSGESLVRQFLWGQRYTREHFGYTADCFWLPDTFGYSAALPQILKGSGVRYFVTTKMAWNDTTRFPYDTFYWKGLDGSRVFCHLARMDVWPSPADLRTYLVETRSPDAIREKHVSRRKLIAYGFGDGGGGPQFEMLEIARRCKDTEGCPKAVRTTASGFLHELEATAKNPSTYTGELYLELHRGTLTNQHEIKRNNRLAEILLHDLDYLTVRRAEEAHRPASDSEYRSLQETLLINQFHDILPGTCIPAAHRTAKAAVGNLLEEGSRLRAALALEGTASVDGGRTLTLHNTTSFSREDVLYLEVPEGYTFPGCRTQRVNTLNGPRLAVSGLTLPPLSAVTVKLEPESAEVSASPFQREGDWLSTPSARIRFNDRNFMESYYWMKGDRELRGEGMALNTFLLAEDLPCDWDNWDIDADIELKFKDAAQLLESSVIADGAVEYRIRSSYRLTSRSTITQDMIFYTESPMVKFETRMDWQENHRLLKTAFDTSIFTTSSTQEIQFGCLRRPTTRNTPYEQAKFEVCNHKYTDLSEPGFGAALLNDCKYGVSVFEGQMRLTLHKGGLRPDDTGDHGEHYCEYAFLPHGGGFSAAAVTKPAYLFNYRPIVRAGSAPLASLLSLDKDNVIAETVKPCEDAENGYILRLYEAEGSFTHCTLDFGGTPREIAAVTLLEEEPVPLSAAGGALSLTFSPFEIKTLRVRY